ncbi:hypothetical protein C0J52_13395 [Blattella germanica]|nr:hypothetical protein C0J52_13395 [Blattella germanica]
MGTTCPIKRPKALPRKMALDRRKLNWLCLVVILTSVALVRAEEFEDGDYADVEEAESNLEKRALGSYGYQKEPGRKFQSVSGIKKPNAGLLDVTNIVYNGGKFVYISIEVGALVWKSG